MTKILFKPGATIRGYSPAIHHILNRLFEVKDDSGVDELTITSVNDSRHMEGSRHYTDEAIDLRSKNFLGSDAKREFAVRLTASLNRGLDTPKFIVIFESEGGINEHFHIQVRRGLKFP